MNKGQVSQFLYDLINSGFTVCKAGAGRYRASKGSSKFEICKWGNSDVPHIGEVTNFTVNGKWVNEPVPCTNFLKQPTT